MKRIFIFFIVILFPFELYANSITADFLVQRCNEIEKGAVGNKFDKDLKRKNQADLCIAYLRSLSWIKSIVIGVESIEQLDENYALFQEKLLNSKEISIVQESFADVPVKLLDPAQWLMQRKMAEVRDNFTKIPQQLLDPAQWLMTTKI